MNLNLDNFWEEIGGWQLLRILAEIMAGVFLVLWACGVFAAIPSGASKYRIEYPRIARSEWGLDAPTASLAGQIAQESGWQDGLISRSGARGLAQFMPTTATWLTEVRPDLKADALYSPAWSLRAQVAYMRWLFGRVTAANGCEQWGFALSAYNGGERWVRRRQALSERPGYCFDATCMVNPGISDASQRENAAYPERVERHWAPQFFAANWGAKACD